MGGRKWGASALAFGALAVVVFAAFGGIASAAEPNLMRARYDELLAKALGVSVDQLNAARTTAQGQLADELLASGEITAEQAARMKAEGGWWEGGFKGRAERAATAPVGPIRSFVARTDVIDTAARVIGISPEALSTEIRAGKTIAAIAAEHGVSRETLKTGMVTAETAAIQSAVTAGRITQAQADAMIASISQHVDQIIDGTGRGASPGIMRGPRGNTPEVRPMLPALPGIR